jgi:hypothetical protein
MKNWVGKKKKLASMGARDNHGQPQWLPHPILVAARVLIEIVAP